MNQYQGVPGGARGGPGGGLSPRDGPDGSSYNFSAGQQYNSNKY